MGQRSKKKKKQEFQEFHNVMRIAIKVIYHRFVVNLLYKS